MHGTNEPSRPATLVELARERAEQQPDARAYTFLEGDSLDGVTLSYAELDTRARAVGALLQQAGASGERVLILYPPGLAYVTAFLGCLYAGAVAVPAYPPDPTRIERTIPRLAVLIADARARFALTQGFIHAMATALAGQARALAELTWLSTDRLDASLAEAWTDPGATADDLAMLQYTSGSTGSPRGVMLTHGNLAHNSAAIHRAFEHTAQSRGMIWLPPYHDMGLIGGVIQPLWGGFPVVLMSPLDFLRRPLRWLAAVSHHRATTSGGPDFAYDLCVRKITPKERATLDLSSWALAFNGAEPINNQTLERFATAFAPCGFRREAFYPCYGLAEATLIASGGAKSALPMVQRFRRADLERGEARVAEDSAPQAAVQRLVGSGTSLPDAELIVVDPGTRVPVAEGVVGEIWLRSPSVARGYWLRPEDTEETFQARRGDTGVGPYLRTGDLGFLHGGELFVTGRIKDLIIVHGRNHYPQDIERTASASHPLLRPGGAAAFAMDGEQGARVALVQELSTDASFDASAVIQAIRAAVAREHDIQIQLVALVPRNGIPKTSSGKIQRYACREHVLAGTLEVLARSALDEQEHAGNAAPAPAALTRDDLIALAANERPAALIAHLAQRVAAALEMPASAIDTTQPLTALGLDSIRAVELAGALEEALDMTLPVTWLLDGASVDRLAARVLDEVASPLAMLRLEPLPGGAVMPLSLAQEQLLFLDDIAPGGSAYNVAAAVELDGDLDIAALAQALDAVARRHAVLRASYPRSGGKWVQAIAPVQITRSILGAEDIEDLGARPEAVRAAEAMQRAADAARQPFDLERGPIVRARLIALHSRQHILVLVFHHIAVDGWSMGVLIRELGALYAAFCQGAPSPLPELPVQYGDFAAWQRRALDEGLLAPAFAYWEAQLAGAPPRLDLPGDRPRPPVQSFAGARHGFTVPAALVASLRALGRAEGATLFMTLFAAFLVVLHERTGRTDLIVGTNVANRDHAHTQNLIGLFVNQLVLRVQVEGNPGFRTLLERVRKTALEAYAHHALPFSKLVERLRPRRDPTCNPLFQVMFVLGGAPLPELPGLSVRALELDDGGAPFDLSVLLSEDGDGLRGTLRYSTALFDAGTMARLARDFEATLVVAAARPDMTLSQIQAEMAAAGRRQELADADALRAVRLAKLGRIGAGQAGSVQDRRLGEGRLSAARRREISASPADWVRFDEVGPGLRLPVLARPVMRGFDLAAWAEANRALIDLRLHEHGAILFRDFDIPGAEGFARVMRAVAGDALPYEERSSPRTCVNGNIYTSTDHPRDQRIFLHNEQSYNLVFPLRIAFFCARPPSTGGATPIADTRRIFTRIPPTVRARFLSEGYLYTRNFDHHLGLSWQTAFQTEDRVQVEKYCQGHGIELEWRQGDRLRTRQVRRAAGRHPVTNEPVWFNHATFFHVSTLESALSRELVAVLGEDELPNQTCYGSGAPIEPEVLGTLRAAYEAETVAFPWSQGDLLLLDNMLVAHGRAPFEGSRLILTAMAMPLSWDAVPALADTATPLS